MTLGLALADAPSIPGLAFRTFRGPEDYPGMLDVYQAAHAADGLDDVTSLEYLQRNYATLVNCDPTRDLVIAEVHGRQVAYARVYWQDLVDGAPGPVKEGVNREEADSIKAQLEEAGAGVEVK